MKKIWIGILLALPLMGIADSASDAHEIISESGIRGGLVVHLGCGNGELTAALRMNEAYVVHGLDSDKATVDLARDYVVSQGLAGPVSVEHWDQSELPYAENLVNLIVAESGLGTVSQSEAMRVLTPLGALCVKTGGAWVVTHKPWPEEIDEWTHFFHGPDGNPVAQDTRVGPPRRVQWMADPMFLRFHDKLGRMRGMVSAAGRLFYFCDEGVSNVEHPDMPDPWVLIARDAFNGTLLWKHSLADTWPRGDIDLPLYSHRKIVAVGDRLYVSLGTDPSVLVLDAATGDTLHEYEGVNMVGSVNVYSNLLLVSRTVTGTSREVVAIDLDTHQTLWQADCTGMNAIPLYIVCSEDRVYIGGASLQARNLSTGQVIWSSTDLQDSEWNTSAASLIYSSGKLVFVNNAVGTSVGARIPREYQLNVIDAATGALVWTRQIGAHEYWGNQKMPVHIIDDVVWADEQPLGEEFYLLGLDLHTGALLAQYSTAKVFADAHHRCYPNRATTKYVTYAQRGLDMMDLQTGEPSMNSWLRGDCRFGLLPANGLVYRTPDSCRCYQWTRFTGLSAIAAADENPEADAFPLEQGLAYPASASSVPVDPDDWPMYRYGSLRKASSPVSVPSTLSSRFKIQAGVKISAPTVAEGKLLVGDSDGCGVVAMDAQTGAVIWKYWTGGAVDTPPTVSDGLAVFGCRDGWVYCLRLADGELVWRLRAAPQERRIMVKDRLESAWPSYGTVVIQNGVVYLCAGRSSFLDGGLRFLKVDLYTGSVLNTGTYFIEEQQRVPDALQHGTINDILSADDDLLYLPKQEFSTSDFSCSTFWSSPVVRAYNGLLDDSLFNRNRWSRKTPGGSTLGYALYAVSDNTHQYSLSVVHDNEAWAEGVPSVSVTPGQSEYVVYAEVLSGGGQDLGNGLVGAWRINVPIRVQCMTVTDDKLFVAGFPDEATPGDPWAAVEGRAGGRLWVLSKSDGTKLAEYELDGAPVWDGMAAAQGKVYISFRNGEVVCFAEETQGIQTDKTTLSIPEGGTNTFGIRLYGAPLNTTTVAVSHVGGDTDIQTQGTASFVFNSTTWSNWQTATLQAATDTDWVDGVATVQCSAVGMASVTLVATEVDNDTDPDYTLPFEEPFEALVAGPLDGQHGWSAGAGAVVQSATARDTQALALTKDSASHIFTGAPTNIWISFYVQGNTCEEAPQIDADAVAVAYVNASSNLVAYSNQTPVELSAEVSNGWNKIDIFADYVSKVWKLSLNGIEQFDDFEFYSDQAAFASIQFVELSTNAMYIDNIGITDNLTDSDNDGLPDEWEQTWFNDLDANPGDLAANSDYTVWQCYIAGFDPTDPDAAFLIADLRPLTSESILQWQNATGRIYTIYWTSNLLNGFDGYLTNNFTGGTFTDAVHSAEEKGFYKIDVRLEP